MLNTRMNDLVNNSTYMNYLYIIVDNHSDERDENSRENVQTKMMKP